MRVLFPILITNPTNIRYLTGFVGAAPEERESYVLLTNKDIYLFTNALYIEQAKTLNKKIHIVEISRENPLSKKLANLCSKLAINKLEFEETNLTVAEYKKINSVLTGVELIPTLNRIENIRMIKRPDEIENIRQAAKITDDCFSYIVSKLNIGVSESEIAWKIETYFHKHGADSAFSPIVAFGANSSQPHYHSMNNELVAMNQIVLLDFGARVNGYCADMTRMVFMGKPKPEWVKAYNTVFAAEQKALELLNSGIRSGMKLDEASRQIISEAKLPTYPHSLGHAVGLDIHETPRLSIKKDEILKPCMVVTVEPGVYIENQYGIRLEDLVLLKEDGIEILSHSKYEKIT